MSTEPKEWYVCGSLAEEITKSTTGWPEATHVIEHCAYQALEQKLAVAVECIKAWNEYHKAIYQRGTSGDYDLDPKGFGIAKGHDLDALYFNAMTKMEKALAHINPDTQQEPSHGK